CAKTILSNSPVPASGREMFTTGVDNQTSVDIHVLQGERELANDCRSLARFKLRGIPPMPAALRRNGTLPTDCPSLARFNLRVTPPMPAGLPRIEVRFQIDANGILSVAA